MRHKFSTLAMIALLALVGGICIATFLSVTIH